MFLGKIAANQDLKDIVVKLAKEKGDQAKEERAGVIGVVTRDGRAVGGGRVGAWKKLRDLNRINVSVRRGRTSPRGGYEFAWGKVGPDGTFAIEGLKPGPWYLTFEEPGRASTALGPIELKKGDPARKLDLAVVAGSSIEGRVENVPSSMAGQVWVIAFDDAITRREVQVAADGSFRLDGLPPGRYGLKVGHDAYVDPHALTEMGWPEMAKYRELLNQPGEPWRGAVVVDPKAGETSRGVVLDFRPPEPLFALPPESNKEAIPPR